MNKLRAFKLFLVMMCMLLLTSCWDSENIQDIDYATAIGIDYKDDQFWVYAQMISFTQVSKSEGGSTLEPEKNTFVGIGKGKTLTLAAGDLYTTSQFRIDWGHTDAVVVTEAALKTGPAELFGRWYRFPTNRADAWLFMTKEPLDKVLTTTSLYNFNTLFSLLHRPEEHYKQVSILPPIMIFKHMVNATEPDRSIYIPVLTLNDKQWFTSKKPVPLLEINGAYFESNNGKSKIFSREQLQGYQWLSKKLIRAPLLVEKDGTIYANLTVELNQFKIKPYVVNRELKFNIEVSLTTAITEYLKEVSYSEMVETAQEIAKSQITNLYKLGVENNIDIYNLMEKFRKTYPDQWRKLTNNGIDFILTEDSIEKLDVKIIIKDSGKYKRIK